MKKIFLNNFADFHIARFEKISQQQNKNFLIFFLSLYFTDKTPVYNKFYTQG